jgi:integrase
MSTQHSKANVAIVSKDQIFEEDTWSFDRLGYKEDEKPSGQNNLSFNRIQQPWLRARFKELVWRKRTSVQAYTLISYVRVGKSLSLFLDSEYKRPSIQVITQETLRRYLESLIEKAHATQSSTYSQLNEITTCWIQWGLISKDKYPLITKDMRPRKRSPSQPKGLSFKVQNDLESHVDHEDTEAARMYQVIMETGMRGSELLALKKDSMSQDKDGDWYLTRLNRKLIKDHTVPISHKLATLIKTQIEYIDKYCEVMEITNPSNYLFGHRRKKAFKIYALRTLNMRLHKLTEELSLTNELGLKQNVSSHAFRHTVGTNLINNGVDLVTVQNFLGHESPMMTATYAHLHNKTMRTAINKAQNQLIDIKGKLYSGLDVIREIEIVENDDTPIEAKWLKHQLGTQALPNGICALPIKQTCPHANACLTCTSFRTDKTFIDVHQQQIRTAKYLVDESKAKNYSRQYDLNKQVLDNLTTIVKGLKAVND